MAPCRRHCGRAAAVLLAAALGSAQAAPPMPRVQPSASHVPANLLRISLAFTRPVDGGVLPRLALLHADGRPIEAPFLPQELWSPDGAILTLLLHPGRVKTGLDARETLGPILVPGETVTLTLDGQPLQRWQVDPDDTEGPRSARWRLAPVRAGSRQPLVVMLDGPIDGRAAGYIAIADAKGARVRGAAMLGHGESRWTFTPAQPWRAGAYRLLARGTLEDPAGNRVGGRFETPSDAAPEAPADVLIHFTIAPRDRAGRVHGRPGPS